MKIKFFFSPDTKTPTDGTEFDGEIDMYFNLKASTSQILFHADPQLEVLDPIIITNKITNEEITVFNQEHRPVKNEYYFISLNRMLAVGSYKMFVNFRSRYSTLFENRGVFAVRYLDDLVQK